MSRNSTRLLLSIASLVMLAYSQNAATNSATCCRMKMAGRCGWCALIVAASTVSGKETAAIRAPKQVTMFFGGTWAEESNRVREGQLTNLLTSAGSAKQQEMSKSGLRAVDSRNSFTEDFTDMRLHPPLSDLGIQRQIQTWISTGAMEAPQANSVYVIYLGPGVRSMLRDKVGGQDYLGYYSLVHLDVGTVVYAVVPYDPDTARMQQTAARLLMEAAIDPPAAKRGN